jgi:hypothetical protein
MRHAVIMLNQRQTERLRALGYAMAKPASQLRSVNTVV